MEHEQHGQIVSYGRYRKSVYAAVFKSMERYFTEPHQERLVRYMEINSLVRHHLGNIVPDRLFVESLVYTYSTIPIRSEDWLLGVARKAHEWREYAIWILDRAIPYPPLSGKILTEHEVVVVAEFCLGKKLIDPMGEIYVDRGRLGTFLRTYQKRRREYPLLECQRACEATYTENW